MRTTPRILIIVGAAAALAALAAGVLDRGAASAQDAAHPRVLLERVGTDLTFDRPTHVTAANDGSGRLFVCEQVGTVVAIDKPATAGAKRSAYLDLVRATKTGSGGSEEGLLSVAFHPRFKENGKVYACYTTGARYVPKGRRVPPNAVRTRVSVFTAKPPGAASVDAGTERVVIEAPQPFANHNGGQIAFGPDGMLYLGLGDGGAANDPEGNGQDLSTLLAKIVRIDVDKGDPYAVPKDNPFVGRDGAKPEIFAYGLRNPWRFSFDEKGVLWTGDVGQNQWEMVRKVEKGSNQGWNLVEGTHEFARGPEPREKIVPPVLEYPHKGGAPVWGASITGGFVYRGKRFPALRGAYVFGDYANGQMWGLREQPGGAPDVWRLTERGSSKAISSFGEDEEGELYLCHHAPEHGQVLRLRVAP